MRTLASRLISPDRRLPLEMLGLAFASRFVLFIAAWYQSWVIPPLWPDFIQGPRSIFPWAQWDGWHYARIAWYGYGDPADQGISAFFPLYPALIKLTGELVGVSSIVQMQMVGVVLGWIIFLVSTWFCTVMFETYLGPEVARTAMLLFLFSPFAFFLSTAYTESLFMLEVALCFIFLRKDKPWFAALVAAFATATRVTGLALILPIVYLAWRNREPIVRIAGQALVGASGLLGYMTYTWLIRDDPFAFLNAQAGWGGYRERSWNYIFGLLNDPVGWFLADVGNPIMFLNMVLYGIAAILFIAGVRRVPGEILLFSLAVLAQSFLSVQSMGRYLLPVLTTYFVLALLIHKLPHWQYLRSVIVTGSLTAMVALFLLFAHGAWIV